MRRLVLATLSYPLLFAWLAIVGGTPLTPWAILNWGIAPLVMAASIVLHEAGHLAAARFVGLQVPRVSLGRGPQVALRRFGPTVVEVNAWPLVGFTWFATERRHWRRLRLWLAVLAGPLTTAALAIPLSDLSGVRAAFLPDLTSGPAVPSVVGLVNLLMLVENLVPHGGRDGAMLLRLPFAKEDHLDLLAVTPILLQVEDLRAAGDFGGARRLLEGALARHPQNTGLLNSRAVLDLEEGRGREAREGFLRLLEDPGTRDSTALILRNNLAFVDFLLRDPALLPEAEENSAKALAGLRKAPFVHETRGDVLYWAGRFDEAYPHCEYAYVNGGVPRDRATSAAVLALIEAARGRAREARRWLERARDLDARCRLLPEAEAAVRALDERVAAAEDAAPPPPG